MKQFILLEGPNGVGKTTVGKGLCERITQAAYVDGDWCMDFYPPICNDSVKELAVNNISCYIKNCAACSFCQSLVLDWIPFSQDDRTQVLEYASALGFTVYDIILHCDEESLVQRWRQASSDSRKTEDSLTASRNSLSYFRKLPGISIDTSQKTAEEVVDEILHVLERP